MNTALAYQLLPDDDSNGLRDGKMGFLQHLDELRVRIIRSCIAVAVGMIVAFAFIDRIVTFVLAPSRRMLPSGTRFIYTQPGEAFGLYIQVSLIAGVLLAAPFIMVQVWRFIAPGLYAKERKLAVPFLSWQDAVGDSCISLVSLQICGSDHLHRGRRLDADIRPMEPGDICGADGWPLSGQHSHRVHPKRHGSTAADSGR